jgi:ribosomal protein S18 acetylase RimI-like enzyme
MLVARLDGRIIGIATFNEDYHFLDESRTVWVIADVWVAPMMRRLGIATKLVRAAEKECKAQGAMEVRLQVYATNEAAIRLYTSLGYGTLLYSLRKRL